MNGQDVKVGGLTAVSLTTRCSARLIDFYERAFGFRVIGAERLDGPDFEQLLGVKGGARQTTLRLGRDLIEIVEFDEPGRTYPEPALASDLIFQHFAIVVSNIDQAFARLLTVANWSPISTAGPQRLPEASGGVSAYKFRDPEGHPLEFLAFAPDQKPARWEIQASADICLGVDHSAISVSNTESSVAFYGRLGLTVCGGSLNAGTEQDRLDGLRDVRVAVTPLYADRDRPHVELLSYAARAPRPRPRLANNDVAATRLVFDDPRGTRSGPGDDAGACLADPDGHQVVVRRRAI